MGVKAQDASERFWRAVRYQETRTSATAEGRALILCVSLAAPRDPRQPVRRWVRVPLSCCEVLLGPRLFCLTERPAGTCTDPSPARRHGPQTSSLRGRQPSRVPDGTFPARVWGLPSPRLLRPVLFLGVLGKTLVGLT